MPVGKKAQDRIRDGLRRYQQILRPAKDRDVSESDTVVIIGDMLHDLLGYAKYVEITTEFAIRGTYVDLAVKVDGDVYFLVEAKAIGSDLKDAHVKQAVDYGANLGVEWIVLSNGVCWRIYRVHFGQPVEHTLVAEVDVMLCNPRDPSVIDVFASLSREGFARDSMSAFFEQRQATSRYALAATLLSDRMLAQLRRELRRAFPKVRVEPSFLEELLRNEVLKRELVEGDAAHQAQSMLKKVAKAMARQRERATKDKPPTPQPLPPT